MNGSPERELASRRLAAEFPLVNDHPDVAGVLRRPDLLAMLGPALAAPFVECGVTAVCAPEARGPILGALVAVELRAGLVLARKHERNHPGADRRVVSEPTWRGAREEFQTRSWDLGVDDVVLVVDDWITTGNSIRALRTLIDESGARYAGASAIVDKASPTTLDELAAVCLVDFDDLVARPG